MNKIIPKYLKLVFGFTVVVVCVYQLTVNYKNHIEITQLKQQITQALTTSRTSFNQVSRSLESTCNSNATLRGRGQLVVSYSLYGEIGSVYYNFTETVIQEVAKRYPGWIVRLYTDIPIKHFYPLIERYKHLDVCDVKNLSAGIGDVSDRFGMLWRFLVLGDPLVNRFLSRDIDSAILPREVDAVAEWISLGTMWHVMRDNPYHCIPMLGGTWGVVNQRDIVLTEELRNSILKEKKVMSKGFDQKLLAQIAWPHAKNDLIAHDSFCCTKIKFGIHAFPSARNDWDFVGAPRGQKLKKECPSKCRPTSHSDWIYC